MSTTIWDSILEGETAGPEKEPVLMKQEIEEVRATEVSVSKGETVEEAVLEQKRAEQMEKEQIARLEAELEAVKKDEEAVTREKTEGENEAMLEQNSDNRQKPSILSTERIDFPYLYKFPGQEKSEEILYATREAKIILQMRRAAAVLVSVLIIAMVWGIGTWVGATWLNQTLWITLAWLLTITILVIMFVSWQWMTITWKKTIGILTTYRLIKLVQISPFTNRNQMLPLKEVVDTSSSTRNFWDLIFGLSTFSARSSAASSGVATNDAAEGKLRVNKKYFYWENMENAEDFEHYLHKVMRTLEEKGPNGMHNFRPFAPKLKANHRDEFIKEKYPHYWS